MRLYACVTKSRLHTTVDASGIQTLVCGFEMRYSYSLTISTFYSSIALNKFQGKGHTLVADQASSSTLPCCKRLVERRIDPAHNDLSQRHQVLHALSEAGVKHFRIIPSEYRLRRSRSILAGQGVFHLSKGEKKHK